MHLRKVPLLFLVIILITSIYGTYNIINNIFSKENMANIEGGNDTKSTSNKIIVEVPSDDYPDLQSAIDDIKQKNVNSGTKIEIQLLPGIYNYSDRVIADGLNIPLLNIRGREKTEIVATGVNSIKSHVFNIEYYENDFKKLNYHKVTYNVSSVEGIKPGQFVIIKEVQGDAKKYLHQGVWEIIDVDKLNNQITTLNTSNLTPPKTITSASMTIPKTVIRWTNKTTAFLADHNTSIGTIDNVVFVGTGRPETDNRRGVNGWDMVGGKGGVTGLISRNSSTLSLGKNFAISSFSGSNIYATHNAQINAANAVSSSAARVGFGSASGSSLQVSGAISTGNLLDGIIAQDNSFTFAKNVISSGNHRHGFISSGNGNVNSDNSIAIGNRYSGAVATGSFISANGLTSINNGENGLWVYNGGNSRAVGITAKFNQKYGVIAQTNSHITATDLYALNNGLNDIYAGITSNILVTGYQGNPTFKPNINQLQKDGSIIKN